MLHLFCRSQGDNCSDASMHMQISNNNNNKVIIDTSNGVLSAAPPPPPCVCASSVQFAWFNFAIVYFSGVFVIRCVSFRTEYLFLDSRTAKQRYCVHCWARGNSSEYLWSEEAYSSGPILHL